MAEKIRKCPTSYAEKGDKNGDSENIHSCLVCKNSTKGHLERNILRLFICSAAGHGG
ncbi:hypothetical protein HFK74_15870|uniref:hypothetical protein n=1 Tax=Pseudomonas sp. SbOxS1 TaxID=2723884 RepID=UPI0015D40A61|nr:hypothetical protein [Pseudomonas sp. SbOxS1]NYU04179.1 hypothetical protein [Pseudomonas sp. SbOxS1]